MVVGDVDFSAPPTSIASASPDAMSRAPNPILCVPVVQSVVIQRRFSACLFVKHCVLDEFFSHYGVPIVIPGNCSILTGPVVLLEFIDDRDGISGLFVADSSVKSENLGKAFTPRVKSGRINSNSDKIRLESSMVF